MTRAPDPLATTERPEAGSPAVEPGSPRRWLRSATLVLPGAYAWLTTVVVPVAGRGGPGAARVAAGLGLGLLLLGAVMFARRPRVARALGIHGFAGASLLAWLLAGDAVSVARLEPVRAALGTVGWALHAFSWGNVRELGWIPEADERAIGAAPLQPRGSLPRGAYALLGVAVAGAVGLVALAWRVGREEAALLAHAAATLASVGLVTVAARVAVERGREAAEPRARLTGAAQELALLGALGVAGVVWSLLR
ncbi:MAG: hypothetical protein IT376_12230 [Polyangiaceae bacterium]|nr:hypothetical protein [Polyangiaceae bacterium]